MFTDDKVSDRHKYALLYAISVILLLLVYSQNLNDAYKGEMWELLYISASDQGWMERLGSISSFVCFGAGRFQPLAFFIPYFQYSVIGQAFVVSHLFSLALHLLSGAILAVIASHYLRNRIAVFAIYAVFLFSFVASDVVIWTFFTYIQAHSAILLAAIGLFLAYLRTARPAYLYGSWVAGLLSTLIYEAAVSLFLAQICFAVISGRVRQKKFFLLEAVAPVVIVALYILMAYTTTGLEYRDSNVRLHGMVFAKIITFIVYYFRFNSGLTSEPELFNISSYFGISLPITAWNILGMVLLAVFFALLVYFVIKQRRNLGPGIRPELWFLLAVFAIYVSIIALGRVMPGTKWFEPSGLETQIRYYYFPALVLPLVMGFVVAGQRWHAYIGRYLVVFMIFVIAGNVMNTFRFGERVTRATAPLTAHSSLLISQLAGEEDARRLFIKKMHRDWYMEQISTPREYHAYTFNANRCIVHPEYPQKKVENRPPIEVVPDPGTIGSAISAPMHEVDLRPYPHSASSYHRETGPEHLADESGMWHVVHVPQPPQTAWAKIDFGQDDEKRIIALGVKPRPGHVSHFWDEAIFQGSNDDKSWTDIARIVLSRPPQEGWTTIRVKNDSKYRWYRLYIKGGFSAGRFISFSGWKMYEPSTTK